MRISNLIAFVAVVGVLGFQSPASALTAPANDDSATPTVISVLPFNVQENTQVATEAPSDPTDCVFAGQQHPSNSVWFSFTPVSNADVHIATHAKGYDGEILAVYKNGSQVACVTSYTLKASTTFKMLSGNTYSIMVASHTVGGSLTFNMTYPSAPANDNFEAATAVAATYLGTSNTAGATAETGEPSVCDASSQFNGASVWYTVTPPVDEQVMIYLKDDKPIAAYTGAPVSALSQVACSNGTPFATMFTFSGTAGTPYHVQVTGPGGADVLRVLFGTQPAPSFSAKPSHPVVGKAVTFTDTSFDPDAQSWASSWTFGDGGKGTGSNPKHTYKKAGKYKVTLTITTTDLRTAKVSKVVVVKP